MPVWLFFLTEIEKKYFADGREGWYGNVTGGGVLFVKKFTDIQRASQAPNEAEIEIWRRGDHWYVELENQSAYRLIAPHDTLEYVVKWYLRKLPLDIPVEMGNPSTCRPMG